jgi:hypothetical protein
MLADGLGVTAQGIRDGGGALAFPTGCDDTSAQDQMGRAVATAGQLADPVFFFLILG